MEQFLLNLLKTSLLGALAILLMLLSKPLWRERYRAKARCWLWLALAVFLLFPVDFSVKNAPVQASPPQDYTLFVGTDKTTIQSTDHLFGDMAEKSGQTSTQVRDSIIARPVTDPAQKTTRYIPVTTILFYGYLAGAAAFLLYEGVSYARFRRTVRRWSGSVTRGDYRALLDETARSLSVNAPKMLICEAVTTPAVTGLFRPTLLLPHERYELPELRYILRHELCHLKRRDMLLKLVLLAANAMHWFNPVVYLMLRQADEDIELACDSAATDGLELPERAAYSRTLLAAVQSSVRALPATTCFGGTVERLKRRITNVLGAQKKRGLGIVALVLALTVIAGCAVSWGERAQKNDPFGGTTFSVEEAVYLATEARNAVRGFPYAPDTTFRALTIDSEKRVTMFTVSGDEFVFSPMEAASIDKSTFSALFNDSSAEAWSGMSADELISGNQAVWKGSASDATYEDYYNVLYLFAQKDGSFYVGLAYQALGSDSLNKAIEGIGSVYRLIVENTDTIYASMDDYAAERVAGLKKSMMTYSVSENNEYGARSIVDTIADVRVTQLEMGDSLGNLSPDGTVLELWYFQYEMKPTNENGAELAPIGGQEVTDDGYLNEHWTHYLTVLHYTSGEQTGYQIIGTYTGNDGLWYNGCNYSGEEKAYLHDFYVDYAGLNEPKMFIPNLLNAATDGYGRANQCEAQLVAGEGYYYYVPITAWARSSDAEFWYSRYSTGSYFSVERIEKDIDEALREWTRQGYEVSRSGNVYRIVTSEGMSNTVVTFFSMPNSTCYQVETHWSFDGSTAENEWGWNRDRAVEGEAAILQAMTDSFTITGKILPTQEDASAASTGFDALDEALDALGDMNVLSGTLQYHDLAEPSGPKIEEHTNTNIDYRTTMAEQFRRYSWKEARELKLADTYRERFTVSCGRWRFVLISNHKNALNFFDTGDGQGEATFYSYEVTDAGMETAVWDAFCEWFEKTAADSAASYTATFEGDLALASNAGTVDSLFFCLAGGEGASYTIIPTAPSVPLDRYEYTPINKPKNLDGLDIIQLWPHNGQATCFEFYEGTNTVKYMSGKSESYYRAIGDFSIVDNDGRTLYNMMRRWYDEAEYDALLRDVKPQPKSLSWQEAAQHWADAYYGAHTKATSGSSFKYTWVKALITPAEDTMKVLREEGEIDGSTYCFAVEVQFTPESETALYYAMAGNTDKCTDPSAPKGAYAFWRCCTIQQQGDGRWHGVELGTGW